ncbi:MAG: acyltransferase [Beijerinckiaceae bacterium]|nr:acyltransferase [Beijerinckiaceae bacterium]
MPELRAAAPAAPRERVEWVDTCKGIAIFLVVVGHTLGGLINSRLMSQSPAVSHVIRWIYAFHMPVFFMLSGMFLPRSLRKPLQSFTADKLRTVAYPYVVWSALTIVFQTLLAGRTNTEARWSDLARIANAPVAQFWFLYALLVIMLVFAVLSKLGFRPWMLLLFAIAIHPAITPPLTTGVTPLLQARVNAAYVALGAVLGSRADGMDRIARLSMGRLILIVVAGFGLTTGLVWAGLDTNPAYRSLVALPGVAACIALSIAINGHWPLGGVLKVWGRYSLEIYVAHTMASAAVRIAGQKLFHIDNPALHFAAGTFVGLYGPIAFAMACERLGIQYVFTWPRRGERAARAGEKAISEVATG